MCPNSKKKVFSNIFVKSPHFVNKKRGGGENIVTMSLLSSNRLHTSLHVWLSKWDIMFLQQIISYLTRKEYSPLSHSALLKILILTVHNKIILKLTEKIFIKFIWVRNNTLLFFYWWSFFSNSSSACVCVLVRVCVCAKLPDLWPRHAADRA